MDRGGAPDRRLVDPYHLVKVLQAADGAMTAGHLTSTVELVSQHRRQDVVDQARLTRAGNPRDGHETAQREAHRDVTQIVLTGIVNDQLPVGIRRPADIRDGDGPAPG